MILTPETSKQTKTSRQCGYQVSHELKTPLTNIRMYGELLQASLRDEEGKSREHADIIVSESQRLSRLIGNFLTFGSKGRGALRLHRKPGVVDEVIAGVIERFRPSLSSRGVEVSFSGGAPRRVALDPDAVEQILDNLLSNVEIWMKLKPLQRRVLPWHRAAGNWPWIAPRNKVLLSNGSQRYLFPLQ